MMRRIVRFTLLPFVVLICSFAAGVTAQQAPPAAAAAPAPTSTQAAPPRTGPTPEQLAIQAASERDHQRMMDLLGIKELRPGVSGATTGSNLANYDESKADLYPNLPDPLVLNNGKRVTSAKVWWKDRRPQIVELFDRRDCGPRSGKSAEGDLGGGEHNA